MNILKKWFKQFSDFLFNANYWDQVPDTCRETFQKELYKKSTGSDHTDNFKFEPVQITKEQKEVMLEALNQPTSITNDEYFNSKIITPLSKEESKELDNIFANQEDLPSDIDYSELFVTSGYLSVDDPTFVNAATSYVDNSQKVEHQLDEQKSEEIKTKKNKRKYNKNKKK